MAKLGLLRGLRLVALIGLAGCVEGGLVASGGGMHEITLLDGAVKVTAPSGYCIDPQASVVRGEALVVLIGRCTATGGVAPAVVSLTIGGPASAGALLAGPDALAKFLTSVRGRRMLARDGNAAHVVVLQAMVEDGSLFLQVNDTSAGEYWRAISAIKGRLVTISASGAEGAPLTPDQGLKLVRDMADQLARRNPDRAMPAAKG